MKIRLNLQTEKIVIMKSVDVLVIGAGPSGTVSAALLKKDGWNVMIVEKVQFPRFVIGESLLPRCLDALSAAGFMEALNRRNYQQKTGAKFEKDGRICDFTFSQQFTKEARQSAWQMQRADFDFTLAKECERMGIPVWYQQEVTSVSVFEDGSSMTTIKDVEGQVQTIKARFIVDGSGYGRVLPRLFDLSRPSGQTPRMALMTHLPDPNRGDCEEPDRIVIYVHQNDCWIWTIPFADGTTSVGYVAEDSFFQKYSGSNEEQLLAMIRDTPELAARFEGIKINFEPKLLKHWSVTSSVYWGRGFVLTGNVTEFLDPVFSSGVTLATVSAQLAAPLVSRYLKGEAVDWEREYTLPLQSGISVFRTYVNAWYDGSLFDIFFSDTKDESIKAKICSVLAGYVWDESNPFVKNHEKSVRNLVNLLRSE